MKPDVWNIIRITEGREKRICDLLNTMGYTTFVPMRQVTRNQKTLTLPVWRGVVWTQAPYAVTTQLHNTYRETIGIHHIKTPDGQPVTIDNELFAAFRLLAEHPKARFLTNEQAGHLCNGKPAVPTIGRHIVQLAGEPHQIVWLRGMCAVVVPVETDINTQKYTL